MESTEFEASEMPAATVDAKIESPWPTRDLVIGIIPLFLFMSANLILSQLTTYFRPSLAVQVALSLYVAFYLYLIAYPYITLKPRRGSPLITPLRSAELIKEFARAIGYMLLIVFVTGLALKLVSTLFKIEENTAGAWAWIQNDPNQYITIPLLIFSMTLGPVAEEYFFRGFLFNAFKTRFPLWLALIIQAFLFSIVHQYGLWGSLRIFLIGTGLAIIYQYRKTLLSPILVHCAINAFWAVPLIILTLQNYHKPAENWEEAKKQPEWFAESSLEVTGIDPKYNADAEVDFVINQFGSKGAKKWKKEAVAFAAIQHVFPNDRHACARAKLGLSSIYLYHLHDYRRAVVEADDLIELYPEQKEQCALALTNKGYAFFYMNDLVKARDAFQKVLTTFNTIDKARGNAKTGLDWLDRMENKNID